MTHETPLRWLALQALLWLFADWAVSAAVWAEKRGRDAQSRT